MYVSNIPLIKYLIKTLVAQSGSPFSVNKFFNDIKSQGMDVSKMTIHDYLSYVEDAYLLFTVPLFSESIRKTQTNLRKIYTTDTGLIHAYSTRSSENLGHLFENLVYIQLRRRELEVYYYLTEERYEVDFLTKDLNNNFHLYQVVWDMNDPETLFRETRALKKAEEELKIQGEIITPESFWPCFFQ
ncbi:MAG: ATP-binding protein [Gammaproteobacteria bacterium]